MIQTDDPGPMEPRFDYQNDHLEAIEGLTTLEHFARAGLIRSLIHLVKLRASQINGCAYCIDIHSKEAREVGEDEQRLHGLNAWHETSFYTERERAALAWTEALTRIADSGVPDELYRDVRDHFSEEELVALNPRSITPPKSTSESKVSTRRAEANPASPKATKTNWRLASRREWIVSPDHTGTNWVIAPMMVIQIQPANRRWTCASEPNPGITPVTEPIPTSAPQTRNPRLTRKCRNGIVIGGCWSVSIFPGIAPIDTSHYGGHAPAYVSEYVPSTFR